MLQLSHNCAICRGVAMMPNGLPIPGDTVRQTWGKGCALACIPSQTLSSTGSLSSMRLRYMLNAWVVLRASNCDSKMSAACMYAVLPVLYACQAFVCACPTLDNAHLPIFTCYMS